MSDYWVLGPSEIVRVPFHLGSILFGDTMVPIIESDSILLFGYNILDEEYNLTRFNHQNKHYSSVTPSKPPNHELGPARFCLAYKTARCWVEDFFGWCRSERTLRVRVPNNHILTQSLYYNSYYPRPKDLIIGHMDPRGGEHPLMLWNGERLRSGIPVLVILRAGCSKNVEAAYNKVRTWHGGQMHGDQLQGLATK